MNSLYSIQPPVARFQLPALVSSMQQYSASSTVQYPGHSNIQFSPASIPSVCYSLHHYPIQSCPVCSLLHIPSGIQLYSAVQDFVNEKLLAQMMWWGYLYDWYMKHFAFSNVHSIARAANNGTILVLFWLQVQMQWFLAMLFYYTVPVSNYVSG